MTDVSRTFAAAGVEPLYCESHSIIPLTSILPIKLAVGEVIYEILYCIEVALISLPSLSPSVSPVATAFNNENVPEVLKP